MILRGRRIKVKNRNIQRTLSTQFVMLNFHYLWASLDVSCDACKTSFHAFFIFAFTYRNNWQLQFQNAIVSYVAGSNLCQWICLILPFDALTCKKVKLRRVHKPKVECFVDEYDKSMLSSVGAGAAIASHWESIVNWDLLRRMTWSEWGFPVDCHRQKKK